MIRRGEYLFEETQHFTQWWLWATIVVSALSTNIIFGYALVQQIALGKPWGSKPLSDDFLITLTMFTLSVTGGILWLLYYTMLETRINNFGVEYQFRPFIRSWKKIDRVAIANYEAKRHLPGRYGLHRTLQGQLLNVKEGWMVVLSLHDGSTLALGTQEPEKFIAALDRITHANT